VLRLLLLNHVNKGNVLRTETLSLLSTCINDPTWKATLFGHYSQNDTR